MAGLAAQLQHIKSLYFGPSPAKGVMQDLEYAMRTKGGLTPEEEKTLRVYKFLPAFSFFAGSVWGTLVGWFSFGKGLKLLGLPLPPNPRFGSAREIMHQCPAMLLNTEEGRMKMELANMWHPRRSYIDGTFVERMKEVEAANSDGVARSIAGETNANTTPFGDLMEDSLACVLGSSGCNLESNNPPEKTGTVLKRSELRARRRGRRHHHRHADD
ncbi:uncharacterized protein LOC8064881 isoform X4 [Sorghum bicolor]|uniref:uncharacterized protein LOC8064881 isoform X4 n=1 Tax=Sorghum bicolor TaxID=4558 RepID=UPI000B424F41|nr:uncharacterized protein LOC8064881 isoform X4 [Sorghum bicolor]|eukprot:XP_021307911.1 uncharacterized protein LOC8064881 isoform X4 [Sorghum bicolor]